MTSVTVEFNEASPPPYWKNFLLHLEETYNDGYDNYTMGMQKELLEFELSLNPYFAYNNRYETLFFHDKAKFDKFIEKWCNNEH